MCLLWSSVFFLLISGICLIVIAVRTTVPPSAAAGSVADEIILGSKLARAVIALQDRSVLWGIAAFSLVLGYFGGVIQSLPNTDDQSIEQYILLKQYRKSSHIRFGSRCPNCDARVQGQFCSSCGQERMDSSELTLGRFTLYAISEVLNTDGRFFRSLRLLLTRPGFLTDEYLRARRIRYATPTQLYVVITAVFFLASIKLDFDVDTIVQQIPVLAKNIVKRAALEHVTPEVIKERINDTLENYIPLYTLFMVTAFAFFLRLVYRAWYYVEHLVFALHFISTVLIIWMAFIALELLIPPLQNVSVFLVLAGSLVYLTISLRYVHSSASQWRIVPSALAFIFLFGAYTAVTIALAMFLL